MIPGLPPRLTSAEQDALALRVVSARERIGAGDDSDEARDAFIELRNALVLDVCGRFSPKRANRFAHNFEGIDDPTQAAIVRSLVVCGRRKPVKNLPAKLVNAAKNGIKDFLFQERGHTARFGLWSEIRFIPSVIEPHSTYLDFEESRSSTEDVRELASQCLDALPEKQASVMRLRFGVGEDQPLDFDEIGERTGMGGVKAYHVYTEAVRSLRLKFSQHRKVPAKPRAKRQTKEAS